MMDKAELPRWMGVLSETSQSPPGAQLLEDIGTKKVMNYGAKDAGGRAVLWIRLRFHDPKRSKADDMARYLSYVLRSSLEDVEVQRHGVVVLQDMTGLGFKNLDPAAAKAIFTKVFSNAPVRVGRIVIYNPPWFIGHVLLPIVLSFMSKKLRGRIAIVNGNKPEKITEYIDASALPTELNGSYAVDEDKWAKDLTAYVSASGRV